MCVCVCVCKNLTRSLREPGGPCTKSMEVSESCMERVKMQSRIHITWFSIKKRKIIGPRPGLVYDNRGLL